MPLPKIHYDLTYTLFCYNSLQCKMLLCVNSNYFDFIINSGSKMVHYTVLTVGIYWQSQALFLLALRACCALCCQQTAGVILFYTTPMNYTINYWMPKNFLVLYAV